MYYRKEQPVVLKHNVLQGGVADWRPPRTIREAYRDAAQGQRWEPVPVHVHVLVHVRVPHDREVAGSLLGEGHIETLVTAINLAALLNNTGQCAEAEVLGRSALAQANRTLGPDHPKSLGIARTLAFTLHDQGQATEAEALLSATLATQQCVLGPGHPHTQATVNALRRFQQRG